jgi:hypothetical protein
MKKLLLALALVVSPVMAQNPPIGIKPITVQMQLFCADSFEFLMNVLAADFKEYPVMMGYLKEGQSQPIKKRLNQHWLCLRQAKTKKKPALYGLVKVLAEWRSLSTLTQNFQRMRYD